MQFEEIFPYIVAIVSGIASWLGSYLMSSKKARQEIETVKLNNAHDLDKLMNQHKLDIESLEEKQKLQLELMEKEHQNKLIIMEKEHENEIIRKGKELEDTAKFGAMKDVMSGLMGGLFNSALSDPDMKNEISKKIKEGLNQQSK